MLTLTQISNREFIAGRLVDAGLRDKGGTCRAELFGECAAALREGGVGDSVEAIAHFVPGRLEVLGKHTDYCGGRSIVAATGRGFSTVVVPRRDARVRVLDVARRKTAEFEIDAALESVAGSWPNYPVTVARRLARNFAGALVGAEIAFRNDLPSAAGLSTSSALVTAMFLALSRSNELDSRREYRDAIRSPEDLAGYVAAVENGESFGSLRGDRGVGTFGGSEDHTAILCSRAGVLSQYRYCPVTPERTIAVSPDYVFAIGSSGVTASKTGTAMEKYNRLSLLAAAVLETWQRATGRDDATLHAVVNGGRDGLDRLRAIVTRSGHPECSRSEMLERLDHFHAESEEIVPSVPDRIDATTERDFGHLVDRSQELGARLLKNQIEQTMALAAEARTLGAVAASAFGAGFGGSVWALVRRPDVETFLAAWSERYRELAPDNARRAKFFATDPGPAAFEL